MRLSNILYTLALIAVAAAIAFPVWHVLSHVADALQSWSLVP